MLRFSAKCGRPLTRLLDDALTIEHRHQRTGHRRDEALLGMPRQCKRPRLTDRQRSAGLDDLATEQEPLALGGREEIGLELHSQNGSVRRHEREGRIAAGAVQGRRDDAGMHETMLLRIGGFMRHRQFDFAWLQPHDFDAKRLHDPLPREATAHPLIKFGILRFEGHFETRPSTFVSYSQKRRPLKTKQAGEARSGTVCLRTETGDALARRMMVRGASVSMLMSTNLAAPVSSGDVAGEKLIRHAPPGATRIDRRSTHPSHRTAAGTRHTAATAGPLHTIPVRANAATPV